MRHNLGKWIIATSVASIGGVISFFVIDLRSQELREEQAVEESRRELVVAYMSAADNPDPDVWLRKLRIMDEHGPGGRDSYWQKWVNSEISRVTNTGNIY